MKEKLGYERNMCVLLQSNQEHFKYKTYTYVTKRHFISIKLHNSKNTHLFAVGTI